MRLRSGHILKDESRNEACGAGPRPARGSQPRLQVRAEVGRHTVTFDEVGPKLLFQHPAGEIAALGNRKSGLIRRDSFREDWLRRKATVERTRRL